MVRMRILFAGVVLSLAMGFLSAGRLSGAEAKGVILADDIDLWHAELFLGEPGAKKFIAGPARQGAASGVLEVDSKGNVFIARGSFIQIVTAEGESRVLTGTPGLVGNTDGPPEKTTFGNAADIAMAGDELFYVADAANFTIRKIEKKGGVWQTSTVAGVPGVQGHRDGEGKQALFCFPLDSLAVDENGIVYVLDCDWLRKIENGVVTTLNAGTGEKNGPLAEARFKRLVGGGPCLTYDGQGSLYVADRRGMAIRKVDLKQGVVSTVAGCRPGEARARPRDGQAFEARFNKAGGPVLVFFNRKYGQILVRSADEGDRIRVVADGWVKTWGGVPGSSKNPLTGPWRDCRGGVPCGVDRDGNVYVSTNHCILKVSRRKGGEK